MNETMAFICNCLSFNDGYVDKLMNEFDIDMDEEQVIDILNSCAEQKNYRLFGNLMIREVFSAIQEKYKKDGLEDDKFDWSIDNYCSVLHYDGKEIKSKWQLDGIIREKRVIEEWRKLKKAPREFKLTDRDKKVLMKAGYPEEDMEQIEIEANVCRYTRNTKGLKYEIDRDEVIRAVGRDKWLYSIGRTAFHWSTSDSCKRSKDTISYESRLPGRYDH